MDITPTQKSHKLLFCPNCGEKQNKPEQKYCSNCGDSFYSDKASVKHSTHRDEHNSRLDSIGGWLILPYVGFYATILLGLAEMAFVPFSSQTSVAKKLFLEVLFFCMVGTAITCIIYIHKRSKTLITSVTILYLLGFILSVDSSFKAHNPITAIIDAIVAGLWIAYFHNSKRVNALLSKSSKNNHTEQNSHTVFAVMGSVLAVLVIGLLVGIVAYANHNNKTNVSKLNNLNSQLQSDYNQFASLPSTITYNKSDWDSYYSKFTSELQAINSGTKTSYSSSALSKYNSDIATASTDFMNLVSLDQSLSDMSFQITSDQSSITSDKNLLQSDIASDNTTCNLSADNPYITCDRSLENQEKSYLDTANTQLSNDQQTLKNQQSQASTLDATVLSDLSKLTTDAKTN